MDKCLSDSQIIQYLVHDLDSEELKRCSEHLNQCASCQKRIEIEADDDELKAWQHCHQRQLQEAHAEKQPFSDDRIDRLFRSTISSIQQSGSSQDTSSSKAAPSPTPAFTPPEETPVRTLGNYNLIEQIGQGGMGVVYRATHTHLKKQVVVKLILNGRWDDTNQIQRFYREMEVIGNLDHPNIVKATDAGEIDGTCFLVMEYLDGHDVKSILKAEGKLSITSACYILRQVANGLQYIHNHQLIHRDIKPSNLFLTVDGQVKILDLGLAGLSQGEASDLTDSHCVMGSVYYMAPEQAQSVKRIDHRADIYSLGCAFFQMLTGRPPFKRPSQIETILAHREDPAPHIRVSRPEIPDELEALFQSMLKKDPEERIQTMAEIVEILDHFLYEHSDLVLSESSETRFTESQELRALCNNARLSPAIEALQQTASTQYTRPHKPARLQKKTVVSSVFVCCVLGVITFPFWGQFFGTKDPIPVVPLPENSSPVSAAEPNTSHPELERKAAIWFINHGCELVISGEIEPVNQIEKLPEHDFNITQIDFKPQTITPELLAPLKDLSKLEILYMDDCDVEPGSLKPLEGMRALWKLDLHNSGITDDDLAVVSSLKNLANLSIQKNLKLTDQGVQHLSHLQKLKSVNLARLNVSDKGLQFLRTNPDLIWLSLEETQITDDSVPALKQLHSMEKLYLKKTRISEKEFQDLKNSLKKLIEYSY
ncbi:serine/threonine-protein kinase [Gimesia panareensis]|uniref:serine/threonine-protein kinase n=1 Tax=Gimesia panareensis TaxID=2527978 RepID=UPI00118A5F1B|nr:serine/threonine-protein kinase [Gimesia panareensis]QDU49101.1 Serine/threonine-protein kinase StkP [Gimesia panareensis]